MCMNKMDNQAQIQNHNVNSGNTGSSAKPHVMKNFPGSKKSKETILMVVGSLLVVLVGVFVGWMLAGRAVGSSSGTTATTQTDVKMAKDEAGIGSESDYDSDAEGLLVEGGIEGEGTHHLERDGGPSKYVYLNSTVIDLQSYVGKKVKVWGNTVSGAHAPWLLDVGKLSVVE
jgi:hypothetical protein